MFKNICTLLHLSGKAVLVPGNIIFLRRPWPICESEGFFILNCQIKKTKYNTRISPKLSFWNTNYMPNLFWWFQVDSCKTKYLSYVNNRMICNNYNRIRHNIGHNMIKGVWNKNENVLQKIVQTHDFIKKRNI